MAKKKETDRTGQYILARLTKEALAQRTEGMSLNLGHSFRILIKAFPNGNIFCKADWKEYWRSGGKLMSNAGMGFQISGQGNSPIEAIINIFEYAKNEGWLQKAHGTSLLISELKEAKKEIDEFARQRKSRKQNPNQLTLF